MAGSADLASAKELGGNQTEGGELRLVQGYRSGPGSEEVLRPAPGNARFKHGPSEVAFALNWCGSILVSTGPALRDLAAGERSGRA